MAKTPEQIRSEFADAGDAAEWLMLEYCEFFAALSADEQIAVLDQIDIDLDWMQETNYEPGETTSWELEIFRAEKRAHITAFTEAPPAVGLLDCLSGICEFGDGVVVTHRRAGLADVTLTASWPLGMDETLRLTSPEPDVACTWDEAFAALESN